MYIDAYHDRRNSVIKVAERVNGTRILKDYKPEYVFYYASENGTKLASTGEKVKEYRANTSKEYKEQIESYKNMGFKLFESDHDVVYKTLEKYYSDAKPAIPNVAVIDIEADFDPIRGYAPPSDPFNKITAVSIRKKWLQETHTLVIAPPTLTQSEAKSICDKFHHTVLCFDERTLLKKLVEHLEDADIITGWNSEFYDLPYIIGRIERVLNQSHTRNLCLWDLLPEKREVVEYGKTTTVYRLFGRVHLDYMLLYQKHSYGEKESLKLNFIGELEVGETKVEYDGSLNDMYHNDFELFVKYNRQDTDLLSKIDDKLKFINRSLMIANDASVPIGKTMGSVAWLDAAMIKHAHQKMNVVIPEKTAIPSNTTMKAAGAYVREPLPGLHQWIGSVDITSLYPSVIRLLNLSPETKVAQIRPEYTMKAFEKVIQEKKLSKTKRDGSIDVDWTAVWGNFFCAVEVDMVHDQTDDVLTIDYADGGSVQMTAKELYEILYDKDSMLCITGNGTLIRTDKDGVVASFLTTNFFTRKALQKVAKGLEAITVNGYEIDTAFANELKTQL